MPSHRPSVGTRAATPPTPSAKPPTVLDGHGRPLTAGQRERDLLRTIQERISSTGQRPSLRQLATILDLERTQVARSLDKLKRLDIDIGWR